MKDKRDLYLVAASLLVWGLGEGLFFIFQPLYLQQLGADPLLIGTILGINGFGMALAQVPAGLLSDRWGRRPLMLATWVMGVLAVLMMALARGLALFSLALILYGLTSAALAPMNSYTAHARGNWSVGKAVTFTAAAFSLGAVVGPFAGGYIAERFGLRSVFVVSVFILAVSTLIIFFIHPQPLEQKMEEHEKANLWRNPRFLLSLGMILLIIFALYLPLPLTANFLQNQRGLSLTAIGQLGSLQNLGNVIFLLALGHLPALSVFLVGELSMFLFSALLWKGTGWPFFALAFILSGGYRLGRSVSVAFVRPLVPDSQVGLAFGLVEFSNSLASIAAPVLAGLVYAQNSASLYTLSMAVLTVSFIVTLLINRKKDIIKARIIQK